MNWVLGVLSLFSVTTFAAGNFELPASCKAKLKADALASETAWLQQNGEILASQLEAEVHLGYYPSASDVSVSVTLKDPEDGRQVRYQASVLKTDALDCRVTVVRRDSSACRYSTDDGIEGLKEIKGISVSTLRTIAPHDSLSKIESDQIRTFLGENGEVGDLIRQTDDSELSAAVVHLPTGDSLDYYGAYAGDNPIGILFRSGTTEVVGSNSDDSVCIGYRR